MHAGLHEKAALLEDELGRLLEGHLRALIASDGDPGVGLVDLGVLRLLAEQGDSRASFLADEFGLTRASISRHVALLTDHGLIEQRPDPEDGRAVLLTLTPAGRKTLDAADARRRARFAALTEGWTDQERESVARLLAQLNERGRAIAGHYRAELAGRLPK